MPATGYLELLKWIEIKLKIQSFNILATFQKINNICVCPVATTWGLRCRIFPVSQKVVLDATAAEVHSDRQNQNSLEMMSLHRLSLMIKATCLSPYLLEKWIIIRLQGTASMWIRNSCTFSPASRLVSLLPWLTRSHDPRGSSLSPHMCSLHSLPRKQHSLHYIFCLCDQDATEPDSGREMQISPQLDCRGSSTGSVHGSRLALGKLWHHSVP